jgi:RNA polymerase sigma-70 factor, ECF subfamily
LLGGSVRPDRVHAEAARLDTDRWAAPRVFVNTLCVACDGGLTTMASDPSALFDVTVSPYDGRVTTAGSSTQLDQADLEVYRRELTAHCYRMLGSSSEAEDAVQDTYVRAWKAADSFEGRSSVRTWLYRIATNICIDMSRTPQRRARPVDLGPASAPDPSLVGGTWSEPHWLTPIPDERVSSSNDPATAAEVHESIRLAFVAALQHLPARQRAVLVLCEVLRWPATEVAELLDTSVASVNSALQRARATMAAADLDDVRPVPLAEADAALLEQFVTAFEAYDVAALVQLLRDDVRFSMPPYPVWFQGPDDVVSWITGPGIECKDGRMLPAGSGNGCPAFASYRKDPAGGYSPWALHILEIHDGRIASWTNFLDPELFPAFGVPRRLDQDGGPDGVVSAEATEDGEVGR